MEKENFSRQSDFCRQPSADLPTIVDRQVSAKEFWQETREEIVEYLKDCDTWELNLRIATLEACNPEKLFTDELQSLVDKALETLPEQTREIFVRSRYNNQSHKEIAVALGISTKTVEFHITKALKVLRVALKDYFPLLAFLPKFFC